MIDSIPYFFDSINRNAIIIKPQKPFFDWLHYIYPDENPTTYCTENNIYLIGEKNNNAEIETWIKRHFDKIFQNELNDWHTDETNWPQKRTFKVFQEWFNYELHSMILDLEDTEIIKD